MTSVRQSATLYREGVELDDLLAELDEAHPGQVRVVDVTYGREGGVLGFFAKRRVGVRYALDAESAGDIDDVAGDVAGDMLTPADLRRLDDVPAIEDTIEISDAAGRHAVSPLDDLLAAADAAETARAAAQAEAMIAHGVAPSDGPDQPNVEFARLLLDLALTKANQRRASEEAARAAFVESGTHVRPAEDLLTEIVPAPAFDTISSAAFDTVGPSVAPVVEPVPALAPIVQLTPPPPAPIAPAPIAPKPIVAAPIAPAAPAANEIWTAPPRRVTAPPPRVAARPAPHRAAITPAVAPVVTRPTVVEPPAAAPADQPSDALTDLLRSVRTRPVGAHRAAPEAGSRTEFTLRRQLAELGVPVSWIPDRAADAYWAIEQLCTRVPIAPALDVAPGAVIVVAGPPAVAQALAHDLCTQHRINPGALVAAGCNAADLPARRDVTQRWQARKLADETRAAGRDPVIVAVNTDDAAWAAGIIAELAPDTMWTVVDATRKPADLGRVLMSLGRESDALAIVNAAGTASPASVWELDAPIALIDGRPASRGTWASLLIDGLAALDL